MARRTSTSMTFWQRHGIVILVVLSATAGLALVLMTLPPAPRADAPFVTVYTDPGCQCCTRWIRYMQQAGFAVKREHPPDLAAVRARLGIPPNYEACHTAVIEGYVVEGHVPLAEIQRLLRERPAARGPAVPGMPVGSPGMEGRNPEDYRVYLLDVDGSAHTYAKYSARSPDAD